MKDIKVSIIVPTYNVELYLYECLKSLVTQTLDEIEILVIDNNSTDTTRKIIKEYMSKYPDKIIYLEQPVQGVSATRNEGLKYARGEYIGFVDSDDHILETMYEKLYISAKENEADMVFSGWVNIVTDGKKEYRTTSFQTPNSHEITNIFENPQILADTNVFVWNKLYKSKIIKDMNLEFDTELHYCEEALFNVQFSFYAEKICHVREALYFYKVKRNGSTTATFNNKIMSIPLSCKKSVDFYRSLGYFECFEEQLLCIYIGYFRRKLYSAFKVSTPNEREVAFNLIDEFFQVMNQCFGENWKFYLRNFNNQNNKVRYKLNYYLTQKNLLKLRIYTPNWLINLLTPRTTFRLLIKKRGDIAI